MAGGRPKRKDAEICPRCGKPGYSYQAPSWNSAYKDASRSLYVRFIHQDRGLPYCYIGKESPEGDLEVAREYLRSTKEVSTYSFRRVGNFIIEKHESFKAIPIVIYYFYKPHPMTKKLKKASLKLGEIESLLEDNTIKNARYQHAYQFAAELRDILSQKPDSTTHHQIIITFDDNSVKEADKISSSNSFIGEIVHRVDKFGILKKIIERRKLSEKLSEGAFGKETKDYTGIEITTTT